MPERKGAAAIVTQVWVQGRKLGSGPRGPGRGPLAPRVLPGAGVQLRSPQGREQTLVETRGWEASEVGQRVRRDRRFAVGGARLQSWWPRVLRRMRVGSAQTLQVKEAPERLSWSSGVGTSQGGRDEQLMETAGVIGISATAWTSLKAICTEGVTL
jgi:hypothetical protein